VKRTYLKHSIEASPLAAKLPPLAGRQVPENARHLLNRVTAKRFSIKYRYNSIE